CALRSEHVEGAWRRLILEYRTSGPIRAFVDGRELARYACSGVVTPDHTIRTKGWPLIVPAPAEGGLADFKREGGKRSEEFITGYAAYFARNNARAGAGRTMLDPLPRVILVPGLGLFGLGRDKLQARIAADLAECAALIIRDAEGLGEYHSIGEADMFDCEYWPPEQAKLAHASAPALAGQVVAVTGAAGAIRGGSGPTLSAAPRAGARVVGR